MSSSFVQVVNGSQVDWSPDGTQLAFAEINRPGMYDSLCVMNMDGTNFRRIAHWALDPRWSPDGSKILCSRIGRLALLDPNEDYTDEMKNEHKLRNLELCNISVGMGDYVWSPDGNTIAFSSDKSLYVVNPDGSNLRYLFEGNNGYLRHISWSPDGRHIAFYHEEIKTIHVTNQSQKTISTRGGYPSWNPVTNKIAFCVGMKFKHFDDKQDLPEEIRIFDFDTGKVEAVGIGRSEIGNNMMNPLVWSPNGKHLAFKLTKYSAFRKPSKAIYLLEPSTRKITQLIEGTHASDSAIKWSPDGSMIAVCLLPDFNTKILHVEQVK